ncbi:MAG: branched-chain amino acid transporter AzlC [Ruminococcaceae bacterium]|nr:branched-chain amino acid transporter AzlC [Oscillospiraceae bacterium]
MNNKERLKKAFKLTIPVLTGYICLGIGFGIILEAKGYGLLWAFCMGLFIYAGSMQYVAVDLISGGASLIATALTTLMVNARHLFYGVSMIEKYKGTGKKKPYLMMSLTDETYSLVVSDNTNDKRLYFFISLFNHCYWVVGCTLGSLIGSVLNFNTNGVEFVLTALFVTVFVEQWLTSKNHISAIIGVLSSVVCLVLFGKDYFLIPSMVVITVVLTLFRKYTVSGVDNND